VLLVTVAFFFFSCYADHRYLHSFPTRRSSDLVAIRIQRLWRERKSEATSARSWKCVTSIQDSGTATTTSAWPNSRSRTNSTEARSEEHTSELQSRENLVCRLLLEKKKQKKNIR